MDLLDKENVVFVGRKPPMNYVLAVITSFTGYNSDEVKLKARGRAITTAVDVAEITRNRFLKEISVGEIVIGTEEMPPRQGDFGVRNVSTMEITLTRTLSPKNEETEKIKKVKAVNPAHSLELTSIEGIGVKRAEKLRANNVTSVQDLANSDSGELSDKLKLSRARSNKTCFLTLVL
jgi:DNA-binding protein